MREASGPAAALAAAGLWASAVTRRDRLPVPASAEDKVAGIEQALEAEGAAMLLAESGGRSVGFALVVPHDRTHELLYLAVDPDAWGRGVAGALLEAVHRAADQAGMPLELWVIADNARAVSTYERAGWTATGEESVRSTGGRPELRMMRETTLR